ncbi:hypothetical protein, partial [Cysteiniphilum marinum]|uniref:hypothetical protein n=1 Tax=Cysteiniphilum marinum TaxID=2774191 RepID=UPI001F3652B8
VGSFMPVIGEIEMGADLVQKISKATQEKGGLSAGAITGIVVGSILLFAAVSFGVYKVVQRYRNRVVNVVDHAENNIVREPYGQGFDAGVVGWIKSNKAFEKKIVDYVNIKPEGGSGYTVNLSSYSEDDVIYKHSDGVSTVQINRDLYAKDNIILTLRVKNGTQNEYFGHLTVGSISDRFGSFGIRFLPKYTFSDTITDDGKVIIFSAMDNLVSGV